VFVDKLREKVSADPCRSHDPLILERLAGLGFRRLITCFGVPRDKMTNATGEQAAVCKERVGLQQAKRVGELLQGHHLHEGLVQGAWDPLVHGVP
jgi:hypothetical protein